MSNFIGIDIGSTASKTVIIDDDKVLNAFTLPTGWNGKDTAGVIFQKLEELRLTEDMHCIATGYGRVCVEYAERVVTEITCHGKGGYALFQKDGLIVDIGGQDTKLILVEGGQVKDFLMNDKCAAGTGKFVEVMATRLGAGLEELYELAENGKPLPISSMCTVFAESEVIGHIGAGKAREDIAAGVIDSVAARVAALTMRYGEYPELMLTGGLTNSDYFKKVFSEKTKKEVLGHPFARYAGALGAALLAAGKTSVKMMVGGEGHDISG